MALTEKDKQTLAEISRAALAAAIKGGRYMPGTPGESEQTLHEQRGCFVTLKTNDRLRGCLGCFTSTSPLYQTVADYTRFSALEDPRFTHHRLREAELPMVSIDISCLTPLVLCEAPEKITLGIHGIYVKSRGGAGCFLPQVATETGWTVEEFWGRCCRDKAGLERDAWKRPETQCMTFTADVFDG